MPFFYHPDMKSQNFHFQYLSAGVVNIYQFLIDNKKHLPNTDTFNYLPLTYYTFGSIQYVMRPLMPPGFSRWINDWGPYQNNYQNLPYYLLILKIPYLILDLGIAYLLLKSSNSKKLYIYWLFNPVSFYLIYIQGNFDILPVFLTLLSYYLLTKKTYLSFFIFGLAIALKLYPLIFLPFFLFTASKKIKDLIINSIIALTPLTISIIPFTTNHAFWQSFFGSGLTQTIIESRFCNIPIFPIIYIIILIKFYFSKSVDLSQSIFYLFLLFVSLVNFHPQWLLWFYPFLLLQPKFLSAKNQYILALIFIFIAIYILLFNDNYLTWGHLIPLDPQFINQTSPYDLIRLKFHLDPITFQKYIHYILASISVILFSINEKFFSYHQS